MKWSSNVLNRFVAPGLTAFTQADILDLTDDHPQAPAWLANHFLNNVLRGSFPDGMRQAVLAFIRRSHNAFMSYQEARRLTLEYLEDNDPYNPRLHAYYEALNAWETFVLQASMAFDMFRWLNQRQGVFAKNDGSPEQRLYTMANQIKHTDKCINSGQSTAVDTTPLWLANQGLVSFGVEVTFAEVAEILSDLAQLAERLQDPRGFVQDMTGESAT